MKYIIEYIYTWKYKHASFSDWMSECRMRVCQNFYPRRTEQIDVKLMANVKNCECFLSHLRWLVINHSHDAITMLWRRCYISCDIFSHHSFVWLSLLVEYLVFTTRYYQVYQSQFGQPQSVIVDIDYNDDDDDDQGLWSWWRVVTEWTWQAGSMTTVCFAEPNDWSWLL